VHMDGEGCRPVDGVLIQRISGLHHPIDLRLLTFVEFGGFEQQPLLLRQNLHQIGAQRQVGTTHESARFQRRRQLLFHATTGTSSARLRPRSEFGVGHACFAHFGGGVELGLQTPVVLFQPTHPNKPSHQQTQTRLQVEGKERQLYRSSSASVCCRSMISFITSACRALSSSCFYDPQTNARQTSQTRTRGQYKAHVPSSPGPGARRPSSRLPTKREDGRHDEEPNQTPGQNLDSETARPMLLHCTESGIGLPTSPFVGLLYQVARSIAAAETCLGTDAWLWAASHSNAIDNMLGDREPPLFSWGWLRLDRRSCEMTSQTTQLTQ
jgi:hypothetical protein